jgi:ribose 5-phosphate isomerase A
MGGALTREKIVDSNAQVLVIIVDESKLTDKLGSNQVVPIEVLPFAQSFVVRKIEEIGGKASLRLSGNNRPFITDNGNYIVDVDFNEIEDSDMLERKIKMIPGVIEVGLFINMAHIVYVGYKAKVEKRVRPVAGRVV